jgi:uncharacterized protein
MRFLILAFTLLQVTLASAEGIPQPITPYISDFANLMREDTKTRITQDLSKLRDDTGVEMTVVTIEYLADHGTYNRIEPFATALFNQWGVGNAETNNGILILIARQERTMRIELGQGYPPIYDDIAKTVIDDYAIPHFKRNNYSEGIESVSLETIKRIAEPFANNVEPTVGGSPNGGQSKLPIILFALFGGLIVFQRKVGMFFQSFKKCPNCGQRSLQIERQTTISATKNTKGQEEIYTKCKNCDFDRKETKSVSYRANRGSSGSFGGGSSSGGGASGRW